MGKIVAITLCFLLRFPSFWALPTDGVWYNDEEPVTVLGPIRIESLQEQDKMTIGWIHAHNTTPTTSSIERPETNSFTAQNLTQNEVTDTPTPFTIHWTTVEEPTGRPTPLETTENTLKEEEKVEEKVEEEVRLPGALKPLHYVLKLQPDINGNETVEGFLKVEFEVLRPTSNVTLHMSEIQVDFYSARLSSQKTFVPLLAFILDPVKQIMVVTLNATLETGERYNFSVSYSYRLRQKPDGLFKASYVDGDGRQSGLVSALLQPTFARRAFPCFDEPSLKATFDIFLVREEHMTAICNMPLVETTNKTDQPGWVVDRFNTTVPMSTYQVSLVISELDYLNCTMYRDVQIRVWARPEILPRVSYAQEMAPRILKFLEEYLEIPYPLPKLDIVSLPSSFSTAFEAWGLIVSYSEDALLYDSKTSTLEHIRMLGTILAHEIAHQWFGNLVTPSWWTDFWISEGFASHLATVTLQELEPSWQMDERMVVDTLQVVMHHDALTDSLSVKIPYFNLLNLYGGFSRITYQKGESIIRMMKNFLTPNTFRKGIIRFLRAHQYSSANTDDLWTSLTEASHEDGSLSHNLTVKMIMDSWTLQRGFPVVSVVRSLEGTTAEVSQKPFQATGTFDQDKPPNSTWWIPLTFTSKSLANFNHTTPSMWLKDTQKSITVTSLPPKEEWVIFNLQETGFYRVNYDEANWRLLIQQLKEEPDVIDTKNQAQIVDDAMNLGVAGELSFNMVLDLMEALKNTSGLNAQVVINNIDYMNLMIASTPAHGAFQSFLLSLLLPLYDSLGLSSRDTLTFSERHVIYSKLIRWICALGHMDCISRAETLYHLQMDDPEDNSIIPENLRPAIYCIAIAHGGKSEWQFAFQRYKDLPESKDKEKNEFLAALGCTKDTSLRNQYVESTLGQGPQLPVMKAVRVMESLGSNPRGGQLTGFNYVENHWNVLSNTIGDQYHIVRVILEMATKSFNTEEQRLKVENFVKTHVSEEAMGEVGDPVLAQTRRNVAWMERNYEVIAKWLEENGYSVGEA